MMSWSPFFLFVFVFVVVVTLLMCWDGGWGWRLSVVLLKVVHNSFFAYIIKSFQECFHDTSSCYCLCVRNTGYRPICYSYKRLFLHSFSLNTDMIKSSAFLFESTQCMGTNSGLVSEWSQCYQGWTLFAIYLFSNRLSVNCVEQHFHISVWRQRMLEQNHADLNAFSDYFQVCGLYAIQLFSSHSFVTVKWRLLRRVIVCIRLCTVHGLANGKAVTAVDPRKKTLFKVQLSHEKWMFDSMVMNYYFVVVICFYCCCSFLEGWWSIRTYVDV